ncbi:hypothetical protein NQZ79_g770 [Umbelopsis isabellina]|nr:hypothetical protein NQZ79_g770 [Umbelopsis isabellina]
MWDDVGGGNIGGSHLEGGLASSCDKRCKEEKDMPADLSINSAYDKIPHFLSPLSNISLRVLLKENYGLGYDEEKKGIALID